MMVINIIIITKIKVINRSDNDNDDSNNNKVKLSFRSENVKYVHLQRIQQIS
jgi:hypothetical protein